MKAGFVLDQGEDAVDWTSLLTPEVRLLCGPRPR